MRLAPAVRLVPLALLVAAGVACGSDAPAEYGDDTRANVLAACSAEADRPILADVCTCTYRTIRTRVPYERFAELDRRLRDDPAAPLPDEVLDAVAECIIEVGEL